MLVYNLGLYPIFFILIYFTHEKQIYIISVISGIVSAHDT